MMDGKVKCICGCDEGTNDDCERCQLLAEIQRLGRCNEELSRLHAEQLNAANAEIRKLRGWPRDDWQELLVRGLEEYADELASGEMSDVDVRVTTRTIVIDGREIAISEESFQALKEQLG